MVSWAEEYDSAGEMLVGAYLDLAAKSPSHELLRLIVLDQDRRGWTYQEGFWNRCLTKEEQERPHSKIRAWTHYTFALENATKGLPYELPPKPEPYEEDKAVSNQSKRSLDDVVIPF